MSIKSNYVYYALSLLMLTLSLSVASSKNLRDFLSKNVLGQNKRRVLSVLKFNSKSQSYKIIKVQIAKNILIEIYDQDMQALNVFGLGKYSNGSVFLNGKATELASYDLDNDGLNEIIIPTIGQNTKSVVFIIKYQPSNDTFSLESPVSYLDQLEG